MMIRTMMIAGALLAGTAGMAAAQTAPATMTGTMTAADVGVSPMAGVTAPSYVQYAADSDKYEIASSKLALRYSGRDDVKSYARALIDHHTASTKSLMGALKNEERTIAKPPTRLSAENAALVSQLRKGPKSAFDNTYLTQQIEAHKKAWSLHKGYAETGEDATLRTIAANTVPVIEQHLAQAKALVPAGIAAR